MKKRLLSAMLSGCMLLTAFPSAYAVSLVSPSGIVQNVQTYATRTDIDEKTAELTGDANLSSDVELKNQLNVKGKVEISLNSGTLSTKSGNDFTIIVKSGAILTLTGTGGTIKSGEKGAIFIEKGGCVIFNNGTVQADGYAVNAVTVEQGGAFIMQNGIIDAASGNKGIITQGGTVIISGGSITAKNAAVSSEGSSESIITVCGNATLFSDSAPAVSLMDLTTLTVSGDSMINGISARAGTVNITGGTINAPLPSDQNFDDDTMIDYKDSPALPSAVYLLPGSKRNASTKEITLNVSGGELIGKGNGHGVAVYVGSKPQPANVQITGGTIKGGTMFDDIRPLALYLQGTGRNFLINWDKLTVSISGGTFSADPAKANTNTVPQGSEKTVFSDGYSAKRDTSGSWEIKADTTVKSFFSNLTGTK